MVQLVWVWLTRGCGQGPVVLSKADQDRNKLLALHCLHCHCAQLTVWVCAHACGGCMCVCRRGPQKRA